MDIIQRKGICGSWTKPLINQWKKRLEDLETCIEKSGRRVVHRFVPIEHILKPVLKECVAPVSCYWNLELIVHGEAELMLVFQELRTPVNMLVLVWKALCSATQ